MKNTQRGRRSSMPAQDANSTALLEQLRKQAQEEIKHKKLLELTTTLTERRERIEVLEQALRSIYQALGEKLSTAGADQQLSLLSVNADLEGNFAQVQNRLNEVAASLRAKNKHDAELRHLQTRQEESEKELKETQEKLASAQTSFAKLQEKSEEAIRAEHEQEKERIELLENTSTEEKEELKQGLAKSKKALEERDERIRNKEAFLSVQEETIEELRATESKLKQALHVKGEEAKVSAGEHERNILLLSEAKRLGGELTEAQKKISELGEKNDLLEVQLFQVQANQPYIQQPTGSQGGESLDQAMDQGSDSDSEEIEEGGDEIEKLPESQITQVGGASRHGRSQSVATSHSNQPPRALRATLSMTSIKRPPTRGHISEIHHPVLNFVKALMESKLDAVSMLEEVKKVAPKLSGKNLELAIEYLVQHEPKFAAGAVLLLDKYYEQLKLTDADTEHENLDISIKDFDEGNPVHKLLGSLFPGPAPTPAPNIDDEKTAGGDRTFNLRGLDETKQKILKAAAECLREGEVYQGMGEEFADGSVLASLLRDLTKKCSVKGSDEKEAPSLYRRSYSLGEISSSPTNTKSGVVKRSKTTNFSGDIGDEKVVNKANALASNLLDKESSSDAVKLEIIKNSVKEFGLSDVENALGYMINQMPEFAIGAVLLLDKYYTLENKGARRLPIPIVIRKFGTAKPAHQLFNHLSKGLYADGVTIGSSQGDKKTLGIDDKVFLLDTVSEDQREILHEAAKHLMGHTIYKAPTGWSWSKDPNLALKGFLETLTQGCSRSKLLESLEESGKSLKDIFQKNVELATSIGELKEELEAKTQELEAKTALEMQVQDVEQKLAAAQEQKTVAEENLAQLGWNQLGQQQQNTLEHAQSLLDRAGTLESKLALEANLTKAQQQLAEQTQTLAELRASEAKGQELTELQKTLAEQKEKLQAEFEGQKTQLDAEKTALEMQVREVEQKLTAANGQLNSGLRELHVFQEEAQADGRIVVKLEEVLETKKAEVTRLTTEQKALTEAQTKLQEEKKEFEAQTAELEQEKKVLEDQKKELEAAQKELTEQVAKSQAKEVELKTAQEEQVTKSQQALETLQKTLAEQKAALETAETKAQESKTNVEVATTRVTEVERELAEKQEALEAETTRVTTANTKAQESEAKLATQQEEHKQQTEALETAQAKVTELTEAQRKSQTELETAQELEQKTKHKDRLAGVHRQLWEKKHGEELRGVQTRVAELGAVKASFEQEKRGQEVKDDYNSFKARIVQDMYDDEKKELESQKTAVDQELEQEKQEHVATKQELAEAKRTKPEERRRENVSMDTNATPIPIPIRTPAPTPIPAPASSSTTTVPAGTGSTTTINNNGGQSADNIVLAAAVATLTEEIKNLAKRFAKQGKRLGVVEEQKQATPAPAPAPEPTPTPAPIPEPKPKPKPKPKPTHAAQFATVGTMTDFVDRVESRSIGTMTDSIKKIIFGMDKYGVANREDIAQQWQAAAQAINDGDEKSELAQAIKKIIPIINERHLAFEQKGEDGKKPIYYGIGISIKQDVDGKIVVDSVMKGSDAEGKVTKGQVITKIGNTSLEGLDISAVAKLMFAADKELTLECEGKGQVRIAKRFIDCANNKACGFTVINLGYGEIPFEDKIATEDQLRSVVPINAGMSLH